MVSLSMAACIDLIEVAGVTVNGLCRVTFVVCHDGMMLGSDVVQKLHALRHHGFSVLGLLRCKHAECSKDSAVGPLSEP